MLGREQLGGGGERRCEDGERHRWSAGDALIKMFDVSETALARRLRCSVKLERCVYSSQSISQFSIKGDGHTRRVAVNPA